MLIEQIIDRCVIEPDGCVTWRGAHDGKGYPHCSVDGKTVRVFRELYRAFVGEISAEVLHHRCENKGCVNPWHLEEVSKSEHHAFKHPRTLRTHCPKGHALVGDNLYEQKIGAFKNKTQRKCRTCEAARKSTPEYLAYMRAYYYRRKAERAS